MNEKYQITALIMNCNLCESADVPPVQTTKAIKVSTCRNLDTETICTITKIHCPHLDIETSICNSVFSAPNSKCVIIKMQDNVGCNVDLKSEFVSLSNIVPIDGDFKL